MMVRCILLWFGLVLTSLSFVISDMQKFATRNLISSFYTIKVFNIKMLGSIKIIIHFQNVLILKCNQLWIWECVVALSKKKEKQPEGCCESRPGVFQTRFDPDTLWDNYQLDAKASRELLSLRLRVSNNVRAGAKLCCSLPYKCHPVTSYYSPSAKIYYAPL